MQLVSKFNQGIYFLLCVIDILSKYAWVIPLKDKKNQLRLRKLFQKILKNVFANQAKYGQIKAATFIIDK